MDEWVDGRMDGWMDGLMAGWLDGWMVRWTDGWMDGWMDGSPLTCSTISNIFSSISLTLQPSRSTDPSNWELL